MNYRKLSRTVAIVGVSESDQIGVLPGKSALQLHAEGARNALDDAGLTKADVDGLFTAPHLPLVVAEYLGLKPRYIDGTMIGGCSFLAHVEHAMLAIDAGMCDVALITHGESGRSRVAMDWLGGAPPFPQGQFEMPYGLFGAGMMFALAAVRHMHKYGTTREQMAEVSVATRKWAALHPKAMMKEPITIDDVMNARPIAWPFTLLMCCLLADAGGAVVLTSAERAKSLRKPPVYVLGTGEGVTHHQPSMMDDLTTATAGKVSSKRAFEMAGVKHEEIDLAELYDCFAFTPLLALEDLGFCKPGESGPFVSGQRTAPGGDFPMNTNGGGLSCVHSGMYGIFTLIELTRQLRGECGQRQVPNARIGLAHGIGAMFAAASTVILGVD